MQVESHPYLGQAQLLHFCTERGIRQGGLASVHVTMLAAG